jgi:hypothetical protein
LLPMKAICSSYLCVSGIELLRCIESNLLTT